mmetsp:Transcript_5909/g.22470  ORF Transcript_5909/g.22470 Transcript_5909/m.22470 type:complete len:310 (-) Transcript_5909:2284-3213(-)
MRFQHTRAGLCGEQLWHFRRGRGGSVPGVRRVCHHHLDQHDGHVLDDLPHLNFDIHCDQHHHHRHHHIFHGHVDLARYIDCRCGGDRRKLDYHRDSDNHCHRHLCPTSSHVSNEHKHGGSSSDVNCHDLFCHFNGTDFHLDTLADDLWDHFHDSDVLGDIDGVRDAVQDDVDHSGYDDDLLRDRHCFGCRPATAAAADVPRRHRQLPRGACCGGPLLAGLQRGRGACGLPGMPRLGPPRGTGRLPRRPGQRFCWCHGDGACMGLAAALVRARRGRGGHRALRRLVVGERALHRGLRGARRERHDLGRLG